MSDSIKLLFRASAAAIVLAGVLFSVRAFAQVRGDDPFVQMRTNMGEQMAERNDQNLHFPYDPFSPWLSGSLSSGPLGALSPIHSPPPPLGQELPRVEAADVSRLPDMEFNREIFYPPYAILLPQNELTEKDVGRVAAYRSARRGLLQEIQAKFEEGQDDSPERRTAALAELGVRQAERLRLLEADAETIRADTAWAGSLARLDDSRRPLLRLFEAAYYFAGLSIDQRLLLTEIAYEGHALSLAPPKDARAEGADTIYFFPATARIRLPADLPPALDTKIQAFLAEKEALKKELRDAALWSDYFFVRQRTQRFTLLAEQQAPRFAALYALAEEIRMGLAGFRYPDMPGPADLPADLTRRVGLFMARKVETQREVLGQLRTLRSHFAPAHFDIARQGDGLAIVQTGDSQKPVATLAAFNADLARRYTAFAGESEILRRDIQHYTESGAHVVTRSVDQLAADFANSYAAQENWNRYRDYFRAVMVPGLSPAQRRLLFQAALVELAQVAPPTSS